MEEKVSVGSNVKIVGPTKNDKNQFVGRVGQIKGRNRRALCVTFGYGHGAAFPRDSVESI